jgi:hypothetical protein
MLVHKWTKGMYMPTHARGMLHHARVQVDQGLVHAGTCSQHEFHRVRGPPLLPFGARVNELR